MKGVSFVVDAFECVVDVIVYGSHPGKVFFCARRGESIVIIEVYGT